MPVHEWTSTCIRKVDLVIAGDEPFGVRWQCPPSGSDADSINGLTSRSNGKGVEPQGMLWVPPGLIPVVETREL